MAPSNQNNELENQELEQDDAVIAKAFKGSALVFVVLGLLGAERITFFPRSQNRKKKSFKKPRCPIGEKCQR